MRSEAPGSLHQLLESFKSCRPVTGLTHNFYKYPARFAPEFVREAILRFTEPDDVVLDPFIGGGTTAVEAIANGRKVIGIDINPLAHFVSVVKTTPLSPRDKDGILFWVEQTKADDVAYGFIYSATSDPRLRNLPENALQVICQLTGTIELLEFPRQRRFARCALLKLGQWLLDCRDKSAPTFRVNSKLLEIVHDMLAGMEELVDTAKRSGVAKNRITGRRNFLCAPAEAILNDGCLSLTGQKPRLVITSPPYPNVHILYHRWQVRGRKETPAPYYLAGLQDGHGASHYTLGSRSPTGLGNYYSRLTELFRRIKGVITPDAVVLQVVGFYDPSSQLPIFLEAMSRAGYSTAFGLFGDDPVSLAREVPRRRWYTQGCRSQNTGTEFLLCHIP